MDIGHQRRKQESYLCCAQRVFERIQFDWIDSSSERVQIMCPVGPLTQQRQIQEPANHAPQTNYRLQIVCYAVNTSSPSVPQRQDSQLKEKSQQGVQ